MRCEHEHDDGAYVLGALAPAERAAYERHLATCSFCREAVADIAVLPGLLGRLDTADFAMLMDPMMSPPPSPPPPVRVPDVRSAATPDRRRNRHATRVRVLTTAVAAAVVALIVGVGVAFLLGGDPPTAPPGGQTVAMVPVDNAVPVSAQINLDGANGGTRVDLTCYYRRSGPGLKPYTVKLIAYGADDEEEQLGSWVAAPGKQFRMSGVTHFTFGSLARLELVRTDGQALLGYDVP
ncbi:anti-sigma factor family protein [Mangrovihabitans endophyticus]|uniref:Anti-sigma factor n=1 Tax=Mangrovihabitans endophyticus TaxID=1751298 RepID=A0A8J3BZM2_9ACTN|nr:zf-HC2 domain-containing protein [Mangrovihabitans endophyticus]GGK96833.1 anti-sigma factor [Mangrovihabitans endophyticus]